MGQENHGPCAKLWRPDEESVSWEGIQKEAKFEPDLERSMEVGSSWLTVGCIYQPRTNKTFVSNEVFKGV